MSFLQTVVQALGVDTLLPIIEQIEITELEGKGHDYIASHIVLSEPNLEALVKHTGGDLASAQAANKAFGEAFADLVLSLAPKTAHTSS
jgi:hypothetical protein